MRYVKFLSVCVVLAMVGGCGHKLADSKKENQKLTADLAKVQQTLADETAKYKADVEKLNAESAQMQTTAMQSMTAMLKKDQEVQEKLKAKIAELEGKVNAMLAENTKLTSELAEMKKAAMEPKPATPVAQ
jgi:septal ring factor EnvC (AmiA/AmiB activator)